MGYNRNTPGATESTSVSQRKMRVNSIVVDQIFDQEHYKFSDEEDFRGKHRKLTLPNQATPTTLSDELALYSRDDGGDQVVSILYPSSTGESNILFDGDLNNITRLGDLILGATCKFDYNGNIITSFNVSGIDVTTITSGTVIKTTTNFYKVNFTNTLPTNDYFISLSHITEPNTLGPLNNLYIDGDADYNNVVDADFIKLFSILSIGSNTSKSTLIVKIWYLP